MAIGGVTGHTAERCRLVAGFNRCSRRTGYLVPHGCPGLFGDHHLAFSTAGDTGQSDHLVSRGSRGNPRHRLEPPEGRESVEAGYVDDRLGLCAELGGGDNRSGVTAQLAADGVSDRPTRGRRLAGGDKVCRRRRPAVHLGVSRQSSGQGSGARVADVKRDDCDDDGAQAQLELGVGASGLPIARLDGGGS